MGGLFCLACHLRLTRGFLQAGERTSRMLRSLDVALSAFRCRSSGQVAHQPGRIRSRWPPDSGAVLRLRHPRPSNPVLAGKSSSFTGHFCQDCGRRGAPRAETAGFSKGFVNSDMAAPHERPAGGFSRGRGRARLQAGIARGHCSATAKIPPTGVDAVMTIP